MFGAGNVQTLFYIFSPHRMTKLMPTSRFSDPHSTQLHPNDGSLPLFSASELAPTYHDGGIHQCLGCPHYARSCKEPLFVSRMLGALPNSLSFIRISATAMQVNFVTQHRGGCTRVGSAASKLVRWQRTIRTRRWIGTRSRRSYA